MSRPHVQVVLGNQQIPRAVRDALAESGATASFWPLAQAARNGLSTAADAVLLIGPPATRDGLEQVRGLLERIADAPRGTLVVSDADSPQVRFEHPESVPVSFVVDPDADELAIRIAAMIEMRKSLEALHETALARQRAERDAVVRYQHQLRVASQIQRDLVQRPPPRVEGIEFTTFFRPSDYFSGDFYDIHRLDEDHVAIAIADTAGNDLPAALLTVFIKRALRGSAEFSGSGIVEPRHVLRRLNREVLEAEIADCPFVSAVYAVLHVPTRRLTLARGGMPCPLLRRANGEIEVLTVAGGVLGVEPDVNFDQVTVDLGAGDSLLVHSDGLDRVLLRANGETAESRGEGGAGRDGAARIDISQHVRQSAFMQILRGQGARSALEHLAIRHDSLRRMRTRLDDVTVIAVSTQAA